MKYTKHILSIAILLVFLIPVIPFATPAPATTDAPSRSNTMWAVGYQTKAENFNPCTTSPAYGMAFIYETLFGQNFATEEIIPVIGKSMEWADDGSSITVTLNSAAEWSDGEEIDADDVLLSYAIHQNSSRFGADMDERIASIVKDGDDTVIFNIITAYYWSSGVYDMLTTDLYIVPEHIWNDVDGIWADYPDLDLYTNPIFADDYEYEVVTSGPYEPYSLTETLDEELYVRNKDWWGEGRIYTDLPQSGGHPEVDYVGLRQYPTNPAQDTGFLTGQVDLHAGFYGGIWIAMAKNTNIKTWFGQEYPYYLGLGSVLSIAFNHDKYPLDQPWLRRAMAYSIDYDAISYDSTGGYWQKARVGFVDDRSATQKPLYDASLEAEYGVTYDVEAAVEILEDHCTGSVSAGWVTTGSNPTALGPWEILVPIGWTDVVKATKSWADAFTAIGIPCTKVELDFWNGQRIAVMNMDYDLSMNTVTPHLINPVVTFLGGWEGPHQWNDNETGWNTANAREFSDTYQDFEVLEPGSTAQLTAAYRMQELLAIDMPEIPSHANCLWYAYSEEYWEGWTSEENDYQQAVTASTVNTAAAKARMVVNLIVSGSSTEEVIPWTGLIAFTILGVLGLIVITRYTIVHKKRNF